MISNTIKKIFTVFGLEIRRKQLQKKQLITPQRTSMQASLQHIKSLGFNPQTIIDVGAAHGTDALFNVFPDSKHILIEPLKEFKERLTALNKEYSIIYIPKAVGAQKGELKINVHPDLYGTSLLQETDGNLYDGIARTIEVTTLDDIYKENALVAPIILKVDVQGYEIQVLEGGSLVMQQAEVVVLESSLFKFMKEGVDFYEIIHYMKQKGFVVYDMVEGHNRPLDDALAQVDLVFVKEKGQLRNNHNWATPQQRRELQERVKHYN
ncbi:FkbM family methyltransferase [Rhodocytophaga aerolata]|uniref:FkbM family methyltransferase n=1 Tax=Rhodocytophaga aerolata TaxID=455078 RepID=A0ABT8RCD6_9BACT|nr:FkbM family methyltransferase [Rhodocytophaga aerolata]MDO1448843.1 FkbM family methyltransferase [Rhodocytophaga aerolata]